MYEIMCHCEVRLPLVYPEIHRLVEGQDSAVEHRPCEVCMGDDVLARAGEIPCSANMILDENRCGSITHMHFRGVKSRLTPAGNPEMTVNNLGKALLSGKTVRSSQQGFFYF